MRVPSALLFSAVVPCLGGGDGSSRHQKVKRREQALPPFSRSVLGDMSALLQGPPSFLREHMFIADISVGTPPQTMKCLLDTGTADIWIPSRRCRSCEQGHHFHADKSDTFMPAVARTDQGLMPVPVRMDYKSGEVVGFLVQDTIGLGWVELRNQSFLIVEEANLPDHREWDGICGLGWHRMAAEGTGQPLYRHFHPMYHNMQQRADVKPIFSLVPAPDRQAYIVVGEVPEAAVKEGITSKWASYEEFRPGFAIEAARIATVVTIDDEWKILLQKMDALKQTVGLATYKGSDPLKEYQVQGFNMYRKVENKYKARSVSRWLRSKPKNNN